MSDTKQHIVIVTSEFPPQPGGIGNHAYHVALHFCKSNYQVTVIADQRSQTGEDELVFDNTLPFLVHRITLKKKRFLMYLNRVAKTYTLFKKADHIIATGKFSLWNVAFCSLFVKRHNIAIIHGSEVNFKSIFKKKSIDIALKRFKKIIAVSHYTKTLVAHLNKEVKIIPNGIDISQWKQKTELDNLKISGSPKLTTVGRVSSRKGQLNVIKHLQLLQQKFPDVHYHCVGIPEKADQFLNKATELGVAEHVTFHGCVDNDTLKSILRDTDIFIMLSSESADGDVEGFGIAILEANSLGIPAIGSRGCGIEDAIKPNASGLLVDVNNSQDFVNAVTTILSNKNQYAKGSKVWAASHDWSDIIKLYIQELK